MSICVCVNQTIDGDFQSVLDRSSFWADWHHCILYSIHHSSLPEKEHIIMTKNANFFQSLNVIDQTTRKMVPITGRARSFLLVFKNKIERRGKQNKNNRPINLLNGITVSTYFKYTTQS